MTTETREWPRSLGRYELVHLLGQGGMGEVYLAKISGAAGFEKPCIVKTILPALLKDGQFLDRFRHEAKVLVHLVHSSIAQVYDMGEVNGAYFMALEYVAGVDVAYLADQARAQGQAIPVPVSLYLGQKVAEGLGYAHRKTGTDGTPLGIVHRDVSPHNVMVSYEGEVKVIDFGLAKSAARSKYTLPSTVMGKLGYMSPEQARADPLDHRSDIYSCGVMVWELLAGQPLIAHGTVGEMMAAMANPRPPSLHELRPEVDPALDAVVRKALAPNPQDRYSRSDEFARALNEQLLRASSSLGAEEVGNYVKAVCPEAFSAQRQLISRISGVRRTDSSPPASGGVLQVGVSPLPADPRVGLEATTVRPAAGAQDVNLGATLRPMATPLPGAVVPAALPAQVLAPAPSAPVMAAPAVLPPVASPSGVSTPSSGLRSGVIVGGILLLLVLMIGTAVATAYFMGDRRHPSPVGALPPGAGLPPDPGDPRGPHPGDPRGPRPGEPPRGWRPGDPLPPRPGDPPPPPPGEPPPPPEDGAPPDQGPEGLAAEGKPGKPANDAVPAAGSEGPVAAAHAAGSVDSAVVEPAAGTSDEVPSEPQKLRQTKGAAAPYSVKGLPIVSQEKGVYFASGARVGDLRKGMVVNVAGQKPNGKLKTLGTATVVARGPRGKRVLLELDDAAKQAREPLFLLMPEGSSEPAQQAESPAEPAPPAPTPPPPSPRRELRFLVRESGLLDREYVIDNRESEALLRCTATVAGKKRADVTVLKLGQNKVDLSKFRWRVDAREVPRGRMYIECAEGVAEVGIHG
ncbi:serine/threonine protein kinase [Hyalangium versicolor]|uniref:serine/threonine protein kinase n=1 Tax=Hyalangium versicolor TaxID=2861190 RepID=UPI001CC99F05|nr:serine/threonine-protein kinase [Hyalangium versicolor]